MTDNIHTYEITQLYESLQPHDMNAYLYMCHAYGMHVYACVMHMGCRC